MIRIVFSSDTGSTPPASSPTGEVCDRWLRVGEGTGDAECGEVITGLEVMEDIDLRSLEAVDVVTWAGGKYTGGLV